LLLDTTFLIDVDRATGAFDALIGDDDDVAIAAVTVAELQVGVELTTGKRQANRRAFVEDVIAHIPVMNYDLAVAEAHARLLAAVRRQGIPRGAHDLIIAATAVTTGRTLVSADARGVAGLPGVDILTRP
jgi:tRNA(fMet)-specific endonuclease VapC